MERHTEPDYYHGAPSLGCLLFLSALAGLSVVGFGLYHLGALAIQLLQNHF